MGWISFDTENDLKVQSSSERTRGQQRFNALHQKILAHEWSGPIMESKLPCDFLRGCLGLKHNKYENQKHSYHDLALAPPSITTTSYTKYNI